MVIDPRHKIFVMNMQLRQCFARAKPMRLKISQKKPHFSGFFISKKAKGVQKSQIGNSATQELRMCIKYVRKLSIFCYVLKSRKVSFPFPLLRHYEMPECFYVKSCCSELVQQFNHATEFGNVAQCFSTFFASRTTLCNKKIWGNTKQNFIITIMMFSSVLALLIY